jgi:hypothetical protein
MILLLKLDPVIKDWRRKVSSAGACYAQIQTVKAVYDKAAVVAESDRAITLEYPSSKRVSGVVVWSIRKDVVPRREVVWMRRYEM